jgi:hypothetical protein
MEYLANIRLAGEAVQCSRQNFSCYQGLVVNSSKDCNSATRTAAIQSRSQPGRANV